jgi:hypothetical protein
MQDAMVARRREPWTTARACAWMRAVGEGQGPSVTDTKPDEWVVYSPPKSVSFGHQTRLRDPRRAWPAVEAFLRDCTRATLHPRIALTCHGPSRWTDEAVAAARLADARQRFGPEPASTYIHPGPPTWTFAEADLPAALAFAFDEDKFPRQGLGPTRLTFAYELAWKEADWFDDPADATEPRRRASVLGVNIRQQRMFLQPHFVFPAPWDSPVLRAFLARLEPHLPFRFRDQYFKRWQRPQKKGAYGRHLKLDAAWRSRGAARPH